MTARKIVTLVLLVFVAASVIFAVSKETGEPENTVAFQSTGQSVTVYYFHGNMRCLSCNTIERLLQASVNEAFPGELEQGNLVIRIVNVEERENQHFVTDFDLATRTVVVDNPESGWRKLDRVWELSSDSAAFYGYVTEEIALELEESR